MSPTFKKILAIYESYEKGKINSIKREIHEVNPGLAKNSRENYLYFFLATSLNFRRSSTKLWDAALKTYEDTSTRYVFLPEEVYKTRESKLNSDLIKHKLAIQINKHPKIWVTLCKTLYENYSSNPRNIFEEGNNTVAGTLKILQKEKKELFPYLRGPKLSNYMIMIMSYYTDIELSDLYNLSIVPDTHIIKSSKVLNLVSENASVKDVENVWKSILKTLELDPRIMHSALWNWSRLGFSNDKINLD